MRDQVIQSETDHKRPRLKAGDILAVPRINGGYYFIICITSNRFGVAFGLFEGHSQILDVSSSWNPVPIQPPIYSGKALVTNGCWRRIGNRRDLLGKFSEPPPIYHSKADNQSNDKIGRYGSAENSSGALTDLTEDEADEIGLARGKYRQVMLEEELEKHLQSTLF